jgi:hypothetical protein
LGDVHFNLVELAPHFVPPLICTMHEELSLKQFVESYLHSWGDQEFTISMTCGFNMPSIPVKVYEFFPQKSELLLQIQYICGPSRHEVVPTKQRSPALGMMQISNDERIICDRYITDIVENHLDGFGELCWLEDNNDFLKNIFKLMTRVKPKKDDEASLLHEVFRLMVVTFIMSHALTMCEENKHATLSRMHSYAGPGAHTNKFTSPRMTNRQLKYFFNSIHVQIQATVLSKLQHIFKSSEGCDKWLAAFVAVLGMCMALEDQQKNLHYCMSTRAATTGADERDAQGQAEAVCREIDTWMSFVQQIFRRKYIGEHNIFVNSECDWAKEVEFEETDGMGIVRQIGQLVKVNSKSLTYYSSPIVAGDCSLTQASGLSTPTTEREHFVHQPNEVLGAAHGEILAVVIFARCIMI